MIRRWLIDAADRLEAAADLAADLRRTPGLGVEALRVRTDFLADRLWETARRVGILQTVGAGARAQLAHSLCDLYRVARRAHHLALAEGFGGLGEDLEAIASELHALVAEIATFDGRSDEPSPAPPLTQALAGGSR